MSELYPPVEIRTLDRPRWIVENLYAQMEYERVTGRTIVQFRMGSSSDLVARLYGLLKAGAREKETEMLLTPEDVGALIDASNIEETAALMEQVLKAGEEDEPAEDEPPEDEPPEAEPVPFPSAGPPASPEPA